MIIAEKDGEKILVTNRIKRKYKEHGLVQLHKECYYHGYLTDSNDDNDENLRKEINIPEMPSIIKILKFLYRVIVYMISVNCDMTVSQNNGNTIIYLGAEYGKIFKKKKEEDKDVKDLKRYTRNNIRGEWMYYKSEEDDILEKAMWFPPMKKIKNGRRRTKIIID